MKEIRSKIDPTELQLSDKLVYINRVSKTAKGGKRMRFAALVVTGDGAGHVAIGVGKANEVPVAIAKANTTARKNLVKISLAGTTIPHQVFAKFGASEVLLKPAPPGTGILAGGSIRTVLELSGVKDILTKSLGSSNKINMAKATLRALGDLKDPKAEIAKRRGTAEKAVASGG